MGRMLHAVFRVSRRQHDGICQCFSAYEFTALILGLFVTYLYSIANTVFALVCIFILPVVAHILDVVCCILSCHYFRHYNIYWHILGLTHLLYFTADGCIQLIVKRFEFQPVRLVFIELFYLLRIWLEYLHTIRLTGLICGTRAFSPLSNQTQWQLEVSIQYMSLMVWCPVPWVRSVVFLLVMEWLHRESIVFSPKANILLIIVVGLQFQLSTGTSWLWIPVYLLILAWRMAYNYLKLREKTIQCMMLYNALITGLIGPVDYRKPIQRLLTFEQNVMRLGKLTVPQCIGNDKQDSIELINLGLEYRGVLSSLFKNRIFGTKIRISSDLTLSRTRDDSYNRILELTNGNQRLSEFVEAFSTGEDGFLQYIIHNRRLKRYCKRVQYIEQSINGMVYCLINRLKITPDESVELIEKHFGLSSDERQEQKCIMAFEYFSSPGFNNSAAEYAVFTYENQRLIGRKSSCDLLYNIYNYYSRSLNLDIYYASFNKQQIDFEKFLKVSDSRLLSGFDLYQKVLFANRVLQMFFPFGNAFCGTVEEREVGVANEHEVEQFMYQPRGYLPFETIYELVRREQIRLLDLDECVGKFEKFEPHVLSIVEEHKTMYNQNTIIYNKINLSNEQIIGRLFTNILHGSVEVNPVRVQEFLGQEDIIKEFHSGDSGFQEFECVGVPYSMLSSFNVYEFQEFLSKIVHVNVSHSTIDSFMSNDYEKFIAMVKGYWICLSQITSDSHKNMVLLLGAQIIIEQYRVLMRKLMRIKRYNNDTAIIELIHQVAQHFRFDERLYKDVHFEHKMIKKQKSNKQVPQTESQSQRSDTSSLKPTPNAGTQIGSKNERITYGSKNHGFAVSKSFRVLDSKLSQFFLHFKIFEVKYRKTHDLEFLGLSSLAFLIYTGITVTLYVIERQNESGIQRLASREFEQPYAYSNYLLKYVNNLDNFLGIKKEECSVFNNIQAQQNYNRADHYLKNRIPTNSVIIPHINTDCMHLANYQEYQVEEIIDTHANQTEATKTMGSLLSNLFWLKQETTYEEILNLIYLHVVSFLTKILNNNTIYYVLFLAFASLLLFKTILGIRSINEFSVLFEKYTVLDLQEFIGYYEKAIRNTFSQSKSKLFVKLGSRPNSHLVSKCHSKNSSASMSHAGENPSTRTHEPLCEPYRHEFCYIVISIIVLLLSIFLMFRTKEITFLQYDVMEKLTIATNGVNQFLDKNRQIFAHYEEAISLVNQEPLTILKKEQMFENIALNFHQLTSLPEFDALLENRPELGQFETYFMPVYAFNNEDVHADKRIQKEALTSATSLLKQYNGFNDKIFYFVKVALQKNEYAEAKLQGQQAERYFNYSESEDKYTRKYLGVNFVFDNEPRCKLLEETLKNGLISSNDADEDIASDDLMLMANCIVSSEELQDLIQEEEKCVQTMIENLYVETHMKVSKSDILPHYLESGKYSNVFEQAELLLSSQVLNYCLTTIFLVVMLCLCLSGYRKLSGYLSQPVYSHILCLEKALTVLFILVAALIATAFVGITLCMGVFVSQIASMNDYVKTSEELVDYNLVHSKLINGNYTAQDLDFGWIRGGKPNTPPEANQFAQMFGVSEYLKYRADNIDTSNVFERSIMSNQGYMLLLKYEKQQLAMNYLAKMQEYLENYGERNYSVFPSRYLLEAELYFLQYIDHHAELLALSEREFNSINFFEAEVNFLDYSTMLYSILLMLFLVVELYCGIILNHSAMFSSVASVPKKVFKFGLEQVGSGSTLRLNSIFYDKSTAWKIVLQFVPLLIIGLEMLVELMISHLYYRRKYGQLIPWDLYKNLVVDLETTISASSGENAQLMLRSEKEIISTLFSQINHMVQGYSQYGILSTLITPDQQVVTCQRRHEQLPYIDGEYSSITQQTQFQNFVPLMYSEGILEHSRSAVELLADLEAFKASTIKEQKLSILEKITESDILKNHIGVELINVRLISFGVTSILLIAAVVFEHFYGFPATLSRVERGIFWMIRNVIKNQQNQVGSR